MIQHILFNAARQNMQWASILCFIVSCCIPAWCSDHFLFPFFTGTSGNIDQSGNNQSITDTILDGHSDTVIHQADGTDNMDPSILRYTIDSLHNTSPDKSAANDTVVVPQLDKMIVYGKKTTSYTASAKTVKAENFRGNFTDIGSVLNTISGITIRTTGGLGSYSDISIRGSASNQVQVYLDGIPLNTAYGGSVDIGKISLSALQEITVYKGGIPLALMGSNAAGVIDLTSAAKKDIVSAVAEFGSFGYQRAGAFLSHHSKQFKQYCTVDYAHSRNEYPYHHDPTPLMPDNGDESTKYKDNNYFNSFTTVYGNSLTCHESRHSLSSHLMYTGTNSGIFYAATPDSNDGSINNHSISLTENYTFESGTKAKSSLILNGRYKEMLFQRKAPFYIGHQKKRNARYPFIQLQWLGEHAINDYLSWKGVLSGSYEGFTEKDLWNHSVTTAPNSQRLTAHGGLELEANRNELVGTRIKYTLRYERDSTNGFYSHAKFHPSPYTTRAYYPAAELQLYASLLSDIMIFVTGTYSSRSPSFFEKFGQTATTVGNSKSPGDIHHLKPESRWGYESALTYSGKSLSASLVFHQSRVRNKIKFIATSQNVFVPLNINDVHGWGIEGEFFWMPQQWVHIQNSVTYMDNRIYSRVDGWSGNQEPLLPRFKNRSAVSFLFKNLKFTHDFIYTSSYYLDPSNLFFKKNKPLLHASLSIKPLKQTTVTYRIENYLDMINYDYETHPKPGRSHFLVFHLTLQ